MQLFLTFTTQAQSAVSRQDSIPLTKKPDSVKTLNKVDTIKLKISKDSIPAQVDYEAQDSMVLDVDAKKIFLFGVHLYLILPIFLDIRNLVILV